MMASFEDERQIIDLINRYAIALDSADWAKLRTCWADEVDVDYGTGETWSSGDALNAFMKDFHEGLITMHMNGNHTIDDKGPDHATGRTYFKALLLKPDGSPLMNADGWYDDEFRKISGEWKISRRKVHMVRMLEG
jgi:hypothetical protein